MINAERMAEVMLAEIKKQAQADKWNTPYVDGEFGLNEVIVDGPVNLVSMAQAALDELNNQSSICG